MTNGTELELPPREAMDYDVVIVGAGRRGSPRRSG